MSIRQVCALGMLFPALACPQAAADSLRKSVTFYASFDQAPKGDRGGGGLKLSTRFNHETEKGQFVFQKGFDAAVFRISPGAGIAGGALEARDILPRSGRIFFPARGNLAFRPGGWAGSVSFWLKTDPDRMLKTGFCDPVQITQRGASNGGLWVDFNDARPRDLRMGVFPALEPGQKPVGERDPDAPIVWLKGAGFQARDWHHVAMVWENLDTGRPDARAALFVDGKLIGELRNRRISMAWDLDKAGIYVAVSYIGLMDELAVFGRALTAGEIRHLIRNPGALK